MSPANTVTEQDWRENERDGEDHDSSVSREDEVVLSEQEMNINN